MRRAIDKLESVTRPYRMRVVQVVIVGATLCGRPL